MKKTGAYILSFILSFLLSVSLTPVSHADGSKVDASRPISDMDLGSGRGIVNATRVNVRRGPSMKERTILRVADKGTRVEVFGRQGDWFEVKVGSDEGWIHSNLLTLERDRPASEQTMKAPTIMNKKNVSSLEDPGTLIATDHGLTQVDLTAVDADSKVLNTVATMDIASGDNMAKTKAVLVGSAAKSEDLEIQTDNEHGLTTPKHLKLGIMDLFELVREKNERIKSQQLEWKISGEAVKNARSIFEPELTSSYQHEKNRQRNTVEESLTRGYTASYDQRNNNYNAAIEGLVPTGGRLSLGYALQDLSNTFTGEDKEYKTILSANVTQPLLKNRGVKATMANIRIAEADSDMEFQTYRQQMIQVLSDAAMAYWDLYFAQEKLKMRRESVRIAEVILEDNRERVKAGKMAETEILEAEAGRLHRKSLEIEAKQDLILAMNNLRTFFSSSAAEKEIEISVTDRIEIKDVELSFSLE